MWFCFSAHKLNDGGTQGSEGVNKELDLGWKTFSAKHRVQWDVLLCWSLVAQTSAFPPPSVGDPVCLQESSARKSLSPTLQPSLWVGSLGASTRFWELESFPELSQFPRCELVHHCRWYDDWGSLGMGGHRITNPYFRVWLPPSHSCFDCYNHPIELIVLEAGGCRWVSFISVWESESVRFSEM